VIWLDLVRLVSVVPCFPNKCLYLKYFNKVYILIIIIYIYITDSCIQKTNEFGIETCTFLLLNSKLVRGTNKIT